MADKTYRVIQWATGTVGSAALRHFIGNPVIDLAGVYVTGASKAGRDAGEIVGLPPAGVAATDDVDALVAMDADCVLYAPQQNPDLVPTLLRLLRSGKNVVSPAGPFVTERWYPELYAEIDAAARENGVSFHACGVHPGFSGDLLPLTLARLCDRIDRIEVSEVIDKLKNPMIYTEMMGFGSPEEELVANPRRAPDTWKHFYGSLEMIARGLGKEIERVDSRVEFATATKDIPHDYGLVRAGTVGGQHYEWTAYADGEPFIVYHFYWQLGTDIDPLWEPGESCYRVRIAGEPPMEATIMGAPGADGRRPFLGLPWTGILGATAVPAVCEARPGIVTHMDLGIVEPHGVAR